MTWELTPIQVDLREMQAFDSITGNYDLLDQQVELSEDEIAKILAQFNQ